MLRRFLDHPDVTPDDPAVVKARAYILARTHDDGSITDGILNNYNTAISISALSKLPNDPEAAQAVQLGQQYLIAIQWKVGMTLPDGTPITADHPFYGGSGYGRHGRPDMSNTSIMLQALRDSGLESSDPAYIRAMAFVSRCQGVPQNAMHADKINQDGGFIYATSINKNLIGVPESKANPDQMAAAVDKGERNVSGLRTYGSITYAGFKSYVYADLKPEDPLVKQAFNWIEDNFTVNANPGMPDTMNQQGLYYMYMTMGRALTAFGQPNLNTPNGEVNWANTLIEALVKRQADNGSWANPADRWMEGDANLVTAYALTALQAIIK